MLPLASAMDFTVGADLAIALVCGLGFGFALERAGFGSARKLTAVFYFYDMAVVKVMFTAIVVAGIGLWLFDVAGWLRFDALKIPTLFFWAMALGGALLYAFVLLGGGVRLFCSFHVSQQNTFTGRLTPRSFDAVLRKATSHLGRAPATP